jgi:hypothetical protein
LNETLARYLPEHAVKPVFELIVANEVHLKIVNERVTRHGDYRKAAGGKHEITVNANLNKYRFLITLIHEISHLVAFEKFGRNIKPHGGEWKYTFQRLMVPFIGQIKSISLNSLTEVFSGYTTGGFSKKVHCVPNDTNVSKSARGACTCSTRMQK